MLRRIRARLNRSDSTTQRTPVLFMRKGLAAGVSPMATSLVYSARNSYIPTTEEEANFMWSTDSVLSDLDYYLTPYPIMLSLGLSYNDYRAYSRAGFTDVEVEGKITLTHPNYLYPVRKHQTLREWMRFHRVSMRELVNAPTICIIDPEEGFYWRESDFFQPIPSVDELPRYTNEDHSPDYSELMSSYASSQGDLQEMVARARLQQQAQESAQAQEEKTDESVTQEEMKVVTFSEEVNIIEDTESLSSFDAIDSEDELIPEMPQNKRDRTKFVRNLKLAMRAMAYFFYALLIMFIPKANATSHGLIQMSDVGTYWVSSLSQHLEFYLNNPLALCVLVLALSIVVLSLRYFTSTYRQEGPIATSALASYRSLIDLLVSDDQRPEVISPKNILIGFLFETSIYIFMNFIDPTLFFLHPLLVMLLPGHTKIKFLIPTPIFILICQIYYLVCSDEYGYRAKLAFVGERASAILLLIDELRYWAVRRRRVTEWFSNFSSHGVNHMIYLTTLYGLIREVKMTPSKVLCLVGNMGAYFNLTTDTKLIDLIKAPFAQAGYEEDILDSAFSFIGLKFSSLRKLNDIDNMSSKFIARFQTLKTGLRKFIIKTYLQRDPTEYDFQYLYPAWYANFENLSSLNALTDDVIAGYAKVYNRVDSELREAWKLRKALVNTNADKEFPKHMQVWKDLVRNLETRFKGIAPAYTDIRQETICIFVCGLSDTGKTTNFGPAVTRMLFRNEETKFSYHNNVYFPCRSSQYWTGYNPESSWAVAFDDPAVLKMSEIPSDPSLHPYLIFMDLANTCNVVLDQAALQDKGMKFKSKVAFVSNNAEVDTGSFATPSAILNRLVQFEMIPKPEFVELNDVPVKTIPNKNRFYRNNMIAHVDKPEYYFNDMNYLMKKSQERDLIVKKHKMIKHVRWAEENFDDEFEKSVNIMDYCVFRVKKGKLPAYFTVDGQKLKEGDILDSRTLMTLLDMEYKRLAETFKIESAKCDATQDKLDIAEYLKTLKEIEILEPLDLRSDFKDYVSHASNEVTSFMERYRLETKTLIKIAALIAATLMVLVAIHKFFRSRDVEETSSDEIEIFCEDLGIPLAQNDIYVKEGKAKSAAYKVQRYSGKRPAPKWKTPKAQGEEPNPPLRAVHTTHTEEITFSKDLTEDEYDEFFEYPPEEEECDLMLQYSAKQGNQEFRKKYFSKGAVLIFLPGRDRAMCKGIAVKDNLMVVPHHMIPYFGNGFEIKTLTYGTVMIQPHEWKELGNKDDKAIIKLLRLPFQFPNFMNNFVGNDDLPDIVSSQPQLLVPTSIAGNMVMMIASMANASYKIATFSYMKPSATPETMKDESMWITLPRYLYYSCTNAAGYCGSPVVGTYGPFAGKILGMHIAGNYNMSYATLMTKEDIEYILGERAQGLEEYRTEPCVPFPQCRESSMKISKFYREIEEEFGVKKFPPICKQYFTKDGILIEPCQSKLDAFHELEAGLIDMDIDRIVREELTFEPESVGRPLTDEETIFGFGRLNGMDMSTAIGYYLTVNDTRTKIANEGKRKKYFIHRAYDGRIVTPSGWPMIQRIVSERLEKLKTGVLQTEYIASPKTNEALKPGKGVRLFYVGDVITLFMVRKYFGDLLSNVMANNVDNEMAIGVNPYSFDWKRIINKLSRFESANYNDGDVSGMEYNMYFPEVKESIIKSTMGFYRGCDETDNTIRENLIRSLFNCRVIWEGYFHDGMTFNPSGHPLTTFFNCMVIRYWKRYTYYTVQLESIGSLIEFPYNRWNELIVMGDDSVEATHIDIYEWYKPLYAAEVADRFGITITTATKDREFKRKNRLDECDFLKRKFEVTKYGVPIPKLEQTSIETSLLYVKGRHSTEARNSCVDAALCEAYYHGKDYFYRVRDAIMKTKKRKRLSDLIVNNFNYYAQRQAEAYCDTESIIDYSGTYAEFFNI